MGNAQWDGAVRPTRTAGRLDVDAMRSSKYPGGRRRLLLPLSGLHEEDEVMGHDDEYERLVPFRAEQQAP